MTALLADNAGRWESASRADIERIEALARAVATRLLHEPTLRLKSLEQGHGHRTVELLRELFALDGGEKVVEEPVAERQPGDNVRPLRANKRA